MSVYVIVTREGPVRDAAALAKYSEMNRASASAGKFTALKPLAIYGATETWEVLRPTACSCSSSPRSRRREPGTTAPNIRQRFPSASARPTTAS